MNINKFVLYLASVLLFTASVSYAAGFTDVKYPIVELGGCKDQSACESYCEKTANMTACITFGESKGLISNEEARIGKLAVSKIESGQTPGKCKSRGECENYCAGNVNAINECIAFGEELGVIPAEDLAQAKKVAAALQAGAKMPGSCTNKDACESYCSIGEHIDECLAFAEVAGILPADQLAEAKKVAKFVKSGETPGKCSNKEDCDNYCAEDGHFNECLGFAEKAELISKEDAEMARKVGGKGPGDCRGKEACENYCNEEDHADECLNFAIDKGLIPAEDMEKVLGAADKIQKGLEQVPADAKAEVEGCLKENLGAPAFEKLMSGGRPTRNMGGKIEKCFNEVMGAYSQKMMEKAKEQGAPEGVDIEKFKNAPPSAQEIEKIKEDAIKNIPGGIPEGVDVEQFKSGPPSAEQIKAQMMKNIPQGIPGGVPAGIPEGYKIPEGAPQENDGMGY